MGKALRVVVVGDARSDALRVAADLEQCGFDPSFVRAASETDLALATSENCDLVVLCHPNPSLPAGRALSVLGTGTSAPPALVYAETYSEDEIVSLVRAGARDCLRQGDLVRLRAALDRELGAAPVGKRRGGVRADVESGDRYRALIEESPALWYMAWPDEAGSRAYVGPQLLAMTGFTPAEWLAEPDMWVRRLHPEDRERVLRIFREACIAGGRFASEYRILDRDGRVVWWQDKGQVLPGPNGKARFVSGFVLDVTEQKLAEEAASRLRFYDQLTGLPNRELLLRHLGRELAEASRSGQPLSLLILALDRFRDVVSTLGHHNGEVMMKEFADRLRETLGLGGDERRWGHAERVARLRGDEFGVLLPDADATLARQVGDRIMGSLEQPFMVELERSLKVPRLPIEMSASAGIAVFPEHGTEAETLLRRADAAVQAARRLGGGAAVVYSPKCEPHDPRQLALVGELRRALDANELVLHYQPKVDLKRHTVVGAEALLRWPHAKRGFMPASEFIPVAEQAGLGLMRPLTRWVLDRAVGDARGWERAGWTLPVAVNVSAGSLRDGRIVDHVAEALEAHEFPPERLQIEVTESAVMSDEGRAADTLGNLTRRGVSVSIDDFGTGYTRLALLRRLPVSELKIDKSFVIGMAGEGGDETIVRSTSELGHNLDLTVVAEGVEDQWTLDLLGNLGCDQAQGFHIARPMPSDDLVRWLNGSTWKTIEP
jgi:diguanylate cyclase (GGDEF)-like protein/PAS domain S-box-containing protein